MKIPSEPASVPGVGEDARELRRRARVAHRHDRARLQAARRQRVEGEVHRVDARAPPGLVQRQAVGPGVLGCGEVGERDQARPVGAQARALRGAGQARRPQLRPPDRVGEGVHHVVHGLRGQLMREQRHAQQRAAAGVRVGVERGVDARPLQPRELGEHDVGVGVEVRHVHRQRGLGGRCGDLGDLDDLGDARRGVRLVAAPHVADVHPACAGDRPAQRGDLIRRLEDAGHVVEPRRQPERTVGHARRDQRRHACALLGGRRGAVAPAHLVAQGARGHQVGGVARRRPVDRGEERRDSPAAVGRVRPVDRGEVVGGVGPRAGRVRHPVLPDDHRGDALAQQRALHRRVGEQAVGVRVRVDEAGQHQAVGGVGDVVARARLDPADPGDRVALDRDVGPHRPVGGADGPPAQDEGCH